ncbi:MAG: hypothetical protein ACPHRO_13210, partial [Nannocystaceae bacterium]
APDDRRPDAADRGQRSQRFLYGHGSARVVSLGARVPLTRTGRVTYERRAVSNAGVRAAFSVA